MSEREKIPEANKEHESFRFGVASEASERHPARNEDAYLAAPEHGVFAVFDGMGGHASGDVASRIAQEALAEQLTGLPQEHTSESAKKWLTESFVAADRAVTQYGRQQSESRGLGTAGSIMLLASREGRLLGLAGSAADTRVWVFHDNTLRQITIDNVGGTTSATDAQEDMAALQRLNAVKDEEDLAALSPRDQYLFDHRNRVANHLGSGVHTPRIESLDLMLGDRVILTTDGVHDNLTADEIAAILAAINDSAEAAKHLVWQSQQRSRDKDHVRSKPDDMTALVIDWAGQ